MPIRTPLAAALAALSLACGGSAAAGPRGGEIEIESFAWGATTAHELAPPVMSLQDSPVGGPPIARRATITLLSHDTDVPSANPLATTKPAPSAAWYAKFKGVDGSSKHDAPAHTAPKGYLPPPVQAGTGPALAAPQRSPAVTDGTTSTLMLGEKTLRLAPGAPAVRR